jgi:hypothetical protein
MSSAYTRGDGTGSGWLDAAAHHGLNPDETEDYGATNTRRIGCHGSRNNGGGKSGLASLQKSYESTDNEESPVISDVGRQPASSGSGSRSGSSSGGLPLINRPGGLPPPCGGENLGGGARVGHR